MTATSFSRIILKLARLGVLAASVFACNSCSESSNDQEFDTEVQEDVSEDLGMLVKLAVDSLSFGEPETVSYLYVNETESVLPPYDPVDPFVESDPSDGHLTLYAKEIAGHAEVDVELAKRLIEEAAKIVDVTSFLRSSDFVFVDRAEADALISKSFNAAHQGPEEETENDEGRSCLVFVSRPVVSGDDALIALRLLFIGGSEIQGVCVVRRGSKGGWVDARVLAAPSGIS